MPQVIRQEVRDFHQMSVYVNEPTKVKLAPSGNDDDDDEDVKLDRVVYSPSTFTKQHAFKVAPPLPTCNGNINDFFIIMYLSLMFFAIT